MMPHLFRILTKFLVLALFVSASAQAQTGDSSPDLGGIQLFSAVDLTTEIGFENPTADSGRLKVRSFEIAAFAPVDPMFDALVNVAGHDEAGQTEIELHEAVISSTRLIAGTRLKAGRFFLGVGRLNQFHSHDWPFTTAPTVHSRFFADEGVADTGIEVGHLLNVDFLPETVTLDLVAGVTNGWSYGHSHTAGRRPLASTHYLHPTFFFDLGESRGLQIGLNYLGRTDSDSVRMGISGFDMTYKRRAGRVLRTLIQSEIYHRIQSSNYLPLTEEIGGYVFADYALGDEGRWSLGARADAISILSLQFANGDKRANLDYSLVPVLSYRASEFSTFRTSYTFSTETKEGDNARPEQKLELQLIALFGSHPAHDF